MDSELKDVEGWGVLLHRPDDPRGDLLHVVTVRGDLVFYRKSTGTGRPFDQIYYRNVKELSSEGWRKRVK